MRHFAEHSPLLLCLITVLFGAMASLVPVSPVEPVLVAVAAVAPPWLLLPLLFLATTSHMATKTLVFVGGGKMERAFKGRNRERFDKARDRMSGRSGLQRSALFVSSVTGLPPFYLMTALCGTLKMPMREFLVLATTGRTIRFAALIFLPQLFRVAPLHAQSPRHANPPAITVAGQGPETYVLLSGMVGGVSGFKRLEARLVEQGNRVIIIDPYQLSIDSADVSFDALARRVDAELGARGVTLAHVIGHAHGGGVALRLAANAPHRVGQIFLLDVGAQATNRSPVFSTSLRLIPFITKLPMGRAFVRDRYIKGLRANAGRTDWLDEATQRAYAEPVLDNIGRVVSLARRLADAPEPEPLAAVLARVRAPITLVLGQLKRPAGPAAEEMTALSPLGDQVRIETILCVGHFPHEEAPDEVARLMQVRRIIAHNGAGAP